VLPQFSTVLGMSMGGMNAWQRAEAYPDAVGGIVPMVSIPTKICGRNLICRLMVLTTFVPVPNDQGATTPELVEAGIGDTNCCA
jgi:hypothetical protein